MTEKIESPTRVVGIQYEPGRGLPQVILKGVGPLADQILQRRDPVKGPKLVKDEVLLEKLYRLPVDAEIGPELFHLMAILLAHIFSIEATVRGESDV